MTKQKYQKPSGRLLGGLSGAEGACWMSGMSPYGTACTTGVQTYACGPGTTPIQVLDPLCENGSGASNCLRNGLTAQG